MKMRTSAYVRIFISQLLLRRLFIETNVDRFAKNVTLHRFHDIVTGSVGAEAKLGIQSKNLDRVVMNRPVCRRSGTAISVDTADVLDLNRSVREITGRNTLGEFFLVAGNVEH